MNKLKAQKETLTYKKIVSRLDINAYSRLSGIRDKFGFSSNYEIMQYLVACFLRVADPERDDIEEPIPEEIESMFGDLSQADRQFDYVKPKRAINKASLNSNELTL